MQEAEQNNKIYSDRGDIRLIGPNKIPYRYDLETYSDHIIRNNTITEYHRQPSKKPGTIGRKKIPLYNKTISHLGYLSVANPDVVTGCHLIQGQLKGFNIQMGKKKKTYSGLMTNGAKRRFQEAFDELLFNSRPYWTKDPKRGKSRKARMTAWLLTMPDSCGIISGTAFWYLFEKFRKALSHRGIDFDYISKLEFQKNGQPHLHFNVVKYLNYDTIYSTWEQVLRLSGLLDGWYKEHPGKTIQGASFTYLWDDASCTHYLWSYLKKTTQNSVAANCRIWSCSQSLKIRRTKRIEDSREQKELLLSAVALGVATYSEKEILCKAYKSKGLQRIPYMRRLLVYKRITFSSHEDMLKYLTINNKRKVYEYKQHFKGLRDMPDTRGLIFNRKYSRHKIQSSLPYFNPITESERTLLSGKLGGHSKAMEERQKSSSVFDHLQNLIRQREVLLSVDCGFDRTKGSRGYNKADIKPRGEVANFPRYRKRVSWFISYV